MVYLSWRVCSKIVRITKTKILRAYSKIDALYALIAANFSFHCLNDDEAAIIGKTGVGP